MHPAPGTYMHMVIALRFSKRFLGSFRSTRYPAIFALFAAAILASAQQAPAPKAAHAPDRSILVGRGKYIVDSVAMCGTCHTPHTSSGAPISPDTPMDEQARRKGEALLVLSTRGSPTCS